MKPKHFALIWICSFFSYLAIIFSMSSLIPMGTLLGWYNDLFGQISGYDWDELTGDLIFLGGAAINGVLVWLVAAIILKRKG